MGLLKKTDETVVQYHACDANDDIMIDFSLRNHISEAFSHLIVHSFRKAYNSILKYIAYSLLGSLSCAALFGLLLFTTLRFTSIDNYIIMRFTKNYISDLFSTKSISINSASAMMKKKDGSLNIIIDGLKIGNISVPKLGVSPLFFKSIINGKLCFKSINFINADINVFADKEFKNILIMDNFSQHKKGEKIKYIPVQCIKNIFNHIDSDVDYIVSSSKLKLHYGSDLFNLCDFSCTLNKDFSLPKILSFAVSSSQSTKSGVEVRASKNGMATNLDIKVCDFQLNEFSNFILKKKISNLYQLAELTKGYKVSVSGNIKISIKDNKLDYGNFDLTSKEGVIKPKFLRDNLSMKIGKHIDKSNISGELKENLLIINNLNIYEKKSKMSLSGICIPLSKDGIAKIDGTLELCNISRHDLNILPKNIVDSCFKLFDNNVPNFSINSLKMDIAGNITYENSDDIVTSHGIFKIEDGMLAFGDKVINSVSAHGEICKNVINLSINSAKIDDVLISSGNIEIYKDNKWNGNVTITAKSEDLIEKLTNFSHVNIPTNCINMKEFFKGKLSVCGDKNSFTVLSGEAELESKTLKDKLSILWDDKKFHLSGSIETKNGKKFNVNTNHDFTKNEGGSSILINGNNEGLNAVNDFFATCCSGNYVFSSSENWKNGSGEYNLKINLNDAILQLPIIGNIKDRHESGELIGTAVRNGDVLKFSSILVKTDSRNIRGKIEIDTKNNKIISCAFDDLKMKSPVNRLEYYENKDNKSCISLIGNNLDLSKGGWFFNKLNKDKIIDISMRLENVVINGFYKLKQLKGHMVLKNNELIGGTCYGALSNGSVFTITASNTKNSGMLKLLSFDAGQFLREFDICNTVIGGKLILNVVSDISLNNNSRVINCEITDIIVENNKYISKLISLSAPNSLNQHSIGFNGVVCSMKLNDNSIVIDNGKAIGPSVCISFDGKYDRVDDNMDIRGIIIPMNNNFSNSSTIYAPYMITGSVLYPDLAVNPPASSDYNLLSDVFGVNLHTSFNSFSKDSSAENKQSKEIVNQIPVDLEKTGNIEANKMKKDGNTKNRNISFDKKFGITVTRGI